MSFPKYCIIYRSFRKLTTDMEATRTALESEHKLQLLQMQAINALWKKVVSLQPNRDSTNNDNENIAQNVDVVTNLTQTCNLLHSQVTYQLYFYNYI